MRLNSPWDLMRDTCPMLHEPRLTIALRELLNRQRVAAMGTLGSDGSPFVSMVPFALDTDHGHVVIHVSGLALHTRNLQSSPQVSLLVMQSEVAGEPVHALSRVTLDGMAHTVVPETAEWRDARQAYLQRFPEAEAMTQLGDFYFVVISIDAARQVAGFGAARTLDKPTIQEVLRTNRPGNS